MRLVQALGLAWVALAILFYAVPPLMVGRGVSVIALPLALALMVGWRVAIHWLLGHPNVGERILIVGSGESAIEVAREALERRDAGFRIVGFVDNRPELLGQSLVNPRVIGLTKDLAEVVRRESVDRIVVAMGERRGQFPVEQLLDLSLSGGVTIEECASFYERLTGRVSLDMLRPSWLIFSGRGRQARLGGAVRTFLHRGAALVGGLLSLPLALLTALLVKLESPGRPSNGRSASARRRVFTIMKFARCAGRREGRPRVGEQGRRRAHDARRPGDSQDTRGRDSAVLEHPQGEMNFVGPRPERPHFVRQLAEEIPSTSSAT